MDEREAQRWGNEAAYMWQMLQRDMMIEEKPLWEVLVETENSCYSYYEYDYSESYYGWEEEHFDTEQFEFESFYEMQTRARTLRAEEAKSLRADESETNITNALEVTKLVIETRGTRRRRGRGKSRSTATSTYGCILPPASPAPPSPPPPYSTTTGARRLEDNGANEEQALDSELLRAFDEDTREAQSREIGTRRRRGRGRSRTVPSVADVPCKQDACYDELHFPISDCACHPSCLTCGYDEMPIEREHCLTCANGAEPVRMGFARDGPGYCAMPGDSVEAAVSCYKVCDEFVRDITEYSQHQAPTRGLCSNTCYADHDERCDDGGKESDFAQCALGTDCADCGPRNVPPMPPKLKRNFGQSPRLPPPPPLAPPPPAMPPRQPDVACTPMNQTDSSIVKCLPWCVRRPLDFCGRCDCQGCPTFVCPSPPPFSPPSPPTSPAPPLIPPSLPFPPNKPLPLEMPAAVQAPSPVPPPVPVPAPGEGEEGTDFELEPQPVHPADAWFSQEARPGMDASKCIDEHINGDLCSTPCGVTNPWLQVDLGEEHWVVGVVLHNVRQRPKAMRLGDYEIWLGTQQGADQQERCVGTTVPAWQEQVENEWQIMNTCVGVARYVTLILRGNKRCLNLHEITVFALPDWPLEWPHEGDEYTPQSVGLTNDSGSRSDSIAMYLVVGVVALCVGLCIGVLVAAIAQWKGYTFLPRIKMTSTYQQPPQGPSTTRLAPSRKSFDHQGTIPLAERGGAVEAPSLPLPGTPPPELCAENSQLCAAQVCGSTMDSESLEIGNKTLTSLRL